MKPDNRLFFFNLSERWLVMLTLTLTAFVFFIYLPVSFDYDGTVFSSYLRYALVKGDMSGLYQPHHPLYFPLTFGLYKLLSFVLGYNVLEYFHLQLFSLVFGVLTLWMGYKILAVMLPRDCNRRLILPLGTALMAVSYGIWYYSVEAEVHIPGLFFVAAGKYLLCFKPGDTDSFKRHLAAAACLTAAAGFHLTNGLIALSVLAVFYLNKKPLRIIFRFFSFYAGFWVLGLGILALVSNVDLVSHFKNQLMGSDPMSGYHINYWTGGLSFKAFYESLKSVAHGLINPASSILSLAALGMMLGMILLIGWIKRKKGIHQFSVLIAWMTPYFVFFTFWDHRNLEFKLNVLFPLLLLFILSLSKLKKWLVPVLLVSVFTSLAAANYFSFVKPANDSGNNRHYKVAEAILNRTPENAVIIVAGCGSQISIYNKIYISYFAYRPTLILDWMLGKGMSLEQIAQRIHSEQAKGAPVYFFSELLKDGPALQQLLKNHQLDKNNFFNFLTPFQEDEFITLSDGHYLMKAKNKYGK